MRRVWMVAAFAVGSLTGCVGGNHGGESATSSPATSVPPEAPTAAAVATTAAATAAVAVTTPAIVATPEGTAAASPSMAGPTAFPSADPNLLSVSNGTILRSYSPAALDRMNDGSLGNAADGIGAELPADAKPPYVFTFELPGVTEIDSFAASLVSPVAANAPAGNVQIAVSTAGADAGFRDVGIMTGDASGLNKTLKAGVTARWVRVTAYQLFNSVSALGSLAATPPGLQTSGTYIEQPVPDAGGAFVAAGTKPDNRARFVVIGSDLTVTECNERDLIGTYVGSIEGRRWHATFTGNNDENGDTIRAVVNDDASIVAGVYAGNEPVVFMRTADKPKYCEVRASGTGSHHVLVLDQDPQPAFYPADADTALPGYTFDSIGAGMLDRGVLARYDTIVTRGVCKLTDLVSPSQLTLLLQWVAAGHKLILAGVGCETGADFSWLPYPLTSRGPGPESENASMIQVENSALGTNDKNDTAHFVDVAAMVNVQNDLPGALPAIASDPWCGHFFVAKTTNLNGYVQAYAIDGRGILIFDGFNGRDQMPPMQKLRQLELSLPVPSDLPCTQRVGRAFLLEPSQEGTFQAGTATTFRSEMDVLANQAWSGHVTVTASGDLPATVSPSAFDIAGGVVHVTTSVTIPANAKPGVHTLTVSAANGATMTTTSASIALTGIAAIAKVAIAQHQRIRVYGIHFDIDSAHIQPRSEPVIADIASLMRANPSWRFEVSGHTDSDGGAAYNLGLSQRRAEAVVGDLAAKHGIARSRMVPKGYGLSRPVAPNTTDAGKALNRRVELERL